MKLNEQAIHLQHTRALNTVKMSVSTPLQVRMLYISKCWLGDTKKRKYQKCIWVRPYSWTRTGAVASMKPLTSGSLSLSVKWEVVSNKYFQGQKNAIGINHTPQWSGYCPLPKSPGSLCDSLEWEQVGHRGLILSGKPQPSKSKTAADYSGRQKSGLTVRNALTTAALLCAEQQLSLPMLTAVCSIRNICFEWQVQNRHCALWKHPSPQTGCIPRPGELRCMDGVTHEGEMDFS